MYVLEPGLTQLHPIAPIIITVVFSVCIGVIWLLCLSLIIASFGIIRLHPIGFKTSQSVYIWIISIILIDW